MLCVNVPHASGRYPIYIGRNLLQNPSLLPVKAGDKVMIVSNATIAQHYLTTLTATFESLGCQVAHCLLPDGEQYKNLASLEQIYRSLLENHFSRDSLLVALGGGVVGDICGLAAATYQRGVRFIQVPTTLLAQVDSSVGGKTAVNHPLGKNMIGAFYQPSAVLIDINTLKTLPQREISAGLAEVIKYGAALDAPFFQWLEEHIEELMALEEEALKYAISRCCQLKAQIVARDEKEKGERALLNFGHTFGHAIETQMGYGNWLHGEGVAVGMLIASELSALWEKSAFTAQECVRLRELLQKAQLPIYVPKEMTSADFLTLMQRDKKVLQGKIRFVLLQHLGKSFLSHDLTATQITQAIETCAISD